MTCAVCIEPIDGEVYREPLGRNDALVNVCGSCARDPVKPKDAKAARRGIVNNRAPANRAAQVKANRDDLIARGLCRNGAKHGRATDGRLCAKCHEARR